MDTSLCPAGPLGRRATVLATAAVSAVVVVALVGRYTALGASPRFGLEALAGALGCAAVPLVLRRPVPAAIGLAALSVASPAVTPAATSAVVLVARQRSLRTAALVGTAGVLGHLGQWALAPAPQLPFLWWLVVSVVVHAALVAIGALIQARAALLRSLRERARQAEAEQHARVAEARAAERTAMAREMHDVLAHRLSLVATYAGALEFRPDADHDSVARAAGVVRQGVQDALNELRDFIGVLRSDEEDPVSERSRPQPRAVDIERLVAEAQRHGMVVDVDGTVTALSGLPDAAGRAAYRLVQEGLTNARMHAPGEPVSITIRGGAGADARISVRNGLASEPPSRGPGGSGLLGMTERIRLAGGHLEHGVRNGTFVVSATLPHGRGAATS
nr:sensor histidine kinase [uncultured bacterium]